MDCLFQIALLEIPKNNLPVGLCRTLMDCRASARRGADPRHGPMVMSVCRGILRDPNDAEDAFQATFLLLVRKAGSIRKRSALGGWLHRVARHVAIQANSAAAQRRLHERQAGQVASTIMQTSSAFSQELVAALHEEIARLPDKHRLAVVLCDLQAIPQVQAARQLCWSERTLRNRLSEGRERLKRRLTGRGLDLDGSTMGTLLLREARGIVPVAWRETTIRAALSTIHHAAAAGAISAAASELAHEVLKTMFLSTLKLGSAIALLGVTLVGSVTVAVVAQQGLATRNAQPATQQAPKSASKEPPVVERLVINKRVSDFPDKTDLSTPETAQAAWFRTSARMDDQALLELSWVKWEPRDIQRMQQLRNRDLKETEDFNKAQLNAEILEVTIYRGNSAFVISKLDFPPGIGRDPYSVRSFGRINGFWKNLGENRLPSLEIAGRDSESRMYRNYWFYEQVRDKITQGRELSPRGESESVRKRIAPGEPLGITVEKADLMGRVEWLFLHGGDDITARQSVEWGEVQRNKDGNRSIRYNYYETIGDKGIWNENVIFTFDAQGNLVNIQDVEGFPIKKLEKRAKTGTQ